MTRAQRRLTAAPGWNAYPLWERLRRKTLGIRARPQHIIHGWIVDFYLPAANLVVEVDGDVHDLQPDEDARRDQDLGDVGITVLRFRNDEVFANIEAVVARVAEEVLAPYPRYRAPFPPPSGGKGSSAREGTSVGQRVSKGRSPGQ